MYVCWSLVGLFVFLFVCPVVRLTTHLLSTARHWAAVSNCNLQGHSSLMSYFYQVGIFLAGIQFRFKSLNER